MRKGGFRLTMSTKRMILATAMAVILVGCSSAAGDTTTSLAATTTSVATTTTSQATTTTSVATTTTSQATTTTSQPATTTTIDPDASLEMSGDGLRAGGTPVPFGTGDAETIAAISAILGAPDRDSGWIDSFSEYGTCPGSTVRGAHWGGFVVLFTQADTGFTTGGAPHFFAWYYTSEPPELETTRGLAIGASLSRLESLYGGQDLEISENPFDPIGSIWAYDMVGWTGMWGYAEGQDPASRISSINGGLGCGE